VTDETEFTGEHGERYELVMPFRICKSQGGPYDDESFVAGWRLALLDRDLADRAVDRIPMTGVSLRPADMPQVDLIAMKHGYGVASEPWNDAPDDWLLVDFMRESSEVPL